MFLQQAINVTVNFPNLAGDEFVVLFGVCRWCEITYVHMTHRPYQCLVLKHAKWILSMFCKTSQPMYIVLTWNIMFMFVLFFFFPEKLTNAKTSTSQESDENRRCKCSTTGCCSGSTSNISPSPHIGFIGKTSGKKLLNTVWLNLISRIIQANCTDKFFLF